MTTDERKLSDRTDNIAFPEKDEIRSMLDLLLEGIFGIKNEKNILEDCPIGLIDFNQWEWSQGVGLYGVYHYYQQTGDSRYFRALTEWYDARLKEGLPPKNINTMAPMLTMAFLYEENRNPVYFELCSEWCEWAVHSLTRTKYNGMQHVCIDRPNTEQLWDDTLFMTVLFVAKWGTITNNQSYIQEAVYQFLLHAAYLRDPHMGLWYHGWTFDGMHNFAEAFWGRGNCWITAVIVDFLEIVHPEPAVASYLTMLLQSQAEALRLYQAENGEWHTLITDPSSYTEASATAGFGYGILKGVRLGLLDRSFLPCGVKALRAVMNRIDENGLVQQVSYGTAMGDTLDFYRRIALSPMPYGQALALLLLCEGSLLESQTKEK